MFEVLSVKQVTPNMRSVTIGGAAMTDFPGSREGGYLKLGLQTHDGQQCVRTYTIREQRADALDIEFALHGAGGEGGPAVRWSLATKPGETIACSGPGPAKPAPLGRDWYIFAGDMTALPAIAVNLAALPEDARGHAVLEIQEEGDKQDLICPSGFKIHWVINPHPGERPELLVDAIKSITWPGGDAYAWAASEFEAMKLMRAYFRGERELGKDDLYISSYWKKGVGEDQHKIVKRQDAEAQA